jgi:hypothetical protein
VLVGEGEGERVDSGYGFTRGDVDVLLVGEALRAGWAMRGTTFGRGDLGGRRIEGLLGRFVEGLFEEEEEGARAATLLPSRFRARRCFSALPDNDMMVTGLLHSGMVASPTKVGSKASRNRGQARTFKVH